MVRISKMDWMKKKDRKTENLNKIRGGAKDEY